MKAPYMPLYGKDAWSDEEFVAAGWDVQGVFWRLAWWQWAEGSIPDDVRKVIDIIGKPTATRKLWPLVKKFFLPDPTKPGRLVNAKLRKLQGTMSAERERKQFGASVTNAKRSAQRMEKDNASEALRAATASVSASNFRSEEMDAPSPPPDFAAVQRIAAALLPLPWRFQPPEQIVVGWLQTYGEELILETIADAAPRLLKSKHYAFLETILSGRKRDPSERPGARRGGKASEPPAQPETPALQRLDAIREAARDMIAMGVFADTEENDYLKWLAPNGTIRDDALTLDEWKETRVSV